MSLADDFAKLFEGRLDAFGTDEGRCEKPRSDWATYDDYVERVRRHLLGEKPLGVYPARADGTAMWGCIDWDTPDAWDHAYAAWQTYKMLGITSWIERSRSKGYHLWVFVDAPVSMATMRRAGLAVCQLAEASSKEVNPKQEALLPDQVGNYVRLPYPGGGRPERQAVLTPTSGRDSQEGLMFVSDFVDGALEARATPADIERVAGLYVPPPKPDLPPPSASTMEGDAVRRMDGLAYTIWQNGPLEGGDRSGAMWKLACRLREGGKHTAAEARDLLLDANARWGKGDRFVPQIEKIVMKLW